MSSQQYRALQSHFLRTYCPINQHTGRKSAHREACSAPGTVLLTWNIACTNSPPIDHKFRGKGDFPIRLVMKQAIEKAVAHSSGSYTAAVGAGPTQQRQELAPRSSGGSWPHAAAAGAGPTQQQQWELAQRSSSSGSWPHAAAAAGAGPTQQQELAQRSSGRSWPHAAAAGAGPTRQRQELAQRGSGRSWPHAAAAGAGPTRQRQELAPRSSGRS